MIYFCADDYGVSVNGNSRIENCIKNGVLNKVSVLPNGEITDFKERLSKDNVVLTLHINLVEGRPLSGPDDIKLLISDDGYFKHSFIGLLLLSLSPKRSKLKKQIYNEIQNQIKFWKRLIGENVPISIDSHQHTHMIPLVFKTLMRVIKDEGLSVECMRFPDEPILPYIFTPSLYFQYSLVGLIKQWLLKTFAFINRKELKKSNIQSTYFMGIMFSGRINELRIKKLLPHYLKIAKKHNKNVEIGFHPGFIKDGEKLMDGIRKDFEKFYFSDYRNIEYDTLIKYKFE